MTFQATVESVRQHQVPEWYHDAKLGIFIHWGLYSVPGWAPLGDDPFAMMRERGFAHYVRHNPYAEWYQNTLQYEDSPTRRYHQETFGSDFSYYDFAPPFREASASWNPAAWAHLFKQAGAQYVVLTTKHHDGFTLWPTQHPNPFHESYFSGRDLVGELTEAVRAVDMRMGLYYSGGIDWTYNFPRIESMADFMDFVPQSGEYIAYANSQIRELIDRYRPSVLWNDIGYPADANVAELMAYYYNCVADGVINDRFGQRRPPKAWLKPLLKLLLPLLMKRALSGEGGLGGQVHYDFHTPEYATFDSIKPFKWECCRGLGSSFGYNRQDTAETTLTARELVHSFVDIVSKNGNLLINVGPMADGTIPEIQQEPLLALGAWLAENGEAIYGTSPWVTPQATTSDALPVSFTKKGDCVYAILLGEPRGDKIVIPGLACAADATVRLLAGDTRVSHRCIGGKLVVDLPAARKPALAYALRIAPTAQWIG